MSDDLPTYKPSAFYFRRALRATDDTVRLRAIGMTLCSELQFLKQWVRDQGMIPPKENVMQSEVEDKGWPKAK
jgi:hypothetical protein